MEFILIFMEFNHYIINELFNQMDYAIILIIKLF